MEYVAFEQLSVVHHAALFVVDYHLSVPPAFCHNQEVTFTGREYRINFPPNGIAAGRFKWCEYRVGGFSDIKVVWPLRWIAPSDNAYGWLPKLEFGDPNGGPYYNSVNPALINQIQPFKYVAHNGDHVIPAAAG